MTGRDGKLLAVAVAVAIVIGLMLAYNTVARRAPAPEGTLYYTSAPSRPASVTGVATDRTQPQKADGAMATREAQDRDRRQRQFAETTKKDACEARGGSYPFGHCNQR